jgi:hypothetical protein
MISHLSRDDHKLNCSQINVRFFSLQMNLCINVSVKDTEKISTVDIVGDEKQSDDTIIDVQSNECIPPETPSSLSQDPDWPMFDCHHLVIDCSIMGYMDCVGVNMLSQIIEEYKQADITVFLSNCNCK